MYAGGCQRINPLHISFCSVAPPDPPPPLIGPALRFGMAAADRVSNRVPEWRLQVEQVAECERLRALGHVFTYAAGLEGVPLTPKKRGEMRLQGMMAGEPDLRFYFPGPRLVLLENKADGGSLSKDQKARHALLRSLGFDVRVAKMKTTDEARAVILALVEEFAPLG